MTAIFFRRLAVVLPLCAALGSCAPAVGVKALRPEQASRALTANILNSGNPSEKAMEFLHRANLESAYERAPAPTLASIHDGLGQRDESDRLYALAELSFDHAVRSGDRRFYLVSALYAWIFLFENPSEEPLSRYDPRLRVAMDLYNRGVADGLTAPGTLEIDVRPRQVVLPSGTLDIELDEASLKYAGTRLEKFVPLVSLETFGFRNRYRRRGIGAPLAASIVRDSNEPGNRWLGVHAKVPKTALLRFDDARTGLAAGNVRARLELLDVEQNKTVSIEDQNVQIETELSAALAYRLQGSPIWDFEIAGFRRGDLSLAEGNPDNLFMLQPYYPGRVPVVFVHGTASSPARWAEMTNEILNDPVLGSRYQFWYFLYNTGNPISYSASRLRSAITHAVDELDPGKRDPALQRMVVIGHSQGGLLTKLTAVSSSDRFWGNVSNKPIEELKLSTGTQELVQSSLFFEPLPFVKRLVFIATPHRGAMMAGGFFGNIARRLVNLPGQVVGVSADLMRLSATGALNRTITVPTSIENMTSTNPFLVTLAESPIAPGVHTHSIIAVRGKGDPTLGNDGVVAYSSAHIEGVDSELVVRSSHSTQAEPATIEEVRRILYLHLEAQ